MGITDRNSTECGRIFNTLSHSGYRVSVDIRNEKIGFKIREHTLQRIPYMLVIGDSEQQNKTVSVRTREGHDLGEMTLEDFQLVLDKNISRLGRSNDS